MEISCCMIVKNEESVLDDTLRKAIACFDELIIVDTGSMDSTVEIAYKYTDKVFYFEWCGDFSAARNFSISKAKNDFIFILDADEAIVCFNKSEINDLNINESDIMTVRHRNHMDNGQVYMTRLKRLFNRKAYRFEGMIHEQIVPIGSTAGRTIETNISIDHMGYQSEALGRTAKLDRNIELLKQAIAVKGQDAYLFYQTGKAYSLKKELSNAKKYFEKAIEMIDNYECHYALDLVISYGYTLINLGLYSEALKIISSFGIYQEQVDFCFLAGHIYMNNAYFDKAVEQFQKCLSRDEGSIEGINSYLACYNIGIIYECLGHMAEAAGWYKQCKGYSAAEKRMLLILKTNNERGA